MKIEKLANLFDVKSDIEIHSISYDSRTPNENGIFFCIKGLTTDGHAYVDQAIANGAKVIVHIDDLEKKPGITYIQVPDSLFELNRICNILYDYPCSKLVVYAVTGTNGKTTTSYIIENILSHFEKTSYMGTIGVKINGNMSQTHHMTTPDAITFCKTLENIIDSGCNSVAMEVSSHALEQHRVDTLSVDAAIFTNLTHEHLDFHKTMDAYMSAKRKLFSFVKKEGCAILNIDDKYYDEMLRGCSCKVYTYGKNPNADFFIHDIVLSPDKTYFKLKYLGKVYDIKTNLVSEINTYNLTAAIAALIHNGFEMNNIIPLLNNFDVGIGRFQTINSSKLNIIVDFAHTPDGFIKVFEFAKAITPKNNKIVSVFGSAGRRDITKRPILGKIADEYCDKIIICEDDYRDEDPYFIANQILGGIKNKDKASIIIDRYDAIKEAILNSEKGDTILLLSKGLDQYIPKNGKDEFWMGDHIACEKILKEYHID